MGLSNVHRRHLATMEASYAEQVQFTQRERDQLVAEAVELKETVANEKACVVQAETGKPCAQSKGIEMWMPQPQCGCKADRLHWNTGANPDVSRICWTLRIRNAWIPRCETRMRRKPSTFSTGFRLEENHRPSIGWLSGTIQHVSKHYKHNIKTFGSFWSIQIQSR